MIMHQSNGLPPHDVRPTAKLKKAEISSNFESLSIAAIHASDCAYSDMADALLMIVDFEAFESVPRVGRTCKCPPDAASSMTW